MPFYREDDKILDDFRDAGCDIANLDSAHLYAVSKNNDEKRQIKTIQCSVISDTINPELGESSESTLSEMLSGSPTGALTRLSVRGDIVSFYIE